MEFILIKFVFNESYTLLQQVSYLSRFGYLPSSEQLEGALITEAQVRDAVKNLQVRDSPNFCVLLPPKKEHFFQFFAGLDSTGDVDPTTASLLTRPRCGVPDVTHSGRYKIQQLYYSTFLYFTDAFFQDFKTGVAASATACRASVGPGPT